MSSDNKLATRIKELDRKYSELRSNGMMLDALDCLQESLFLRRQLYGDDCDEVEDCSKTFVATCNSVGMSALQAGHPILTFELLVYALSKCAQSTLCALKHRLLRSARQRS
jgi:hypothetical protein